MWTCRKAESWYELNVGTFCDSDGDGTGDFTAARQKLDYLEDLGVTGIWVQPINTSNASAYSTIDYYGLNAAYGTMEELKAFLDAAHEKGIQVVMDLVINHCAYNNPWFEEALQAQRWRMEARISILTGLTLSRRMPTL